MRFVWNLSFFLCHACVHTGFVFHQEKDGYEQKGKKNSEDEWKKCWQRILFYRPRRGKPDFSINDPHLIYKIGIHMRRIILCLPFQPSFSLSLPLFYGKQNNKAIGKKLRSFWLIPDARMHPWCLEREIYWNWSLSSQLNLNYGCLLLWLTRPKPIDARVLFLWANACWISMHGIGSGPRLW